MNRNQTIFRRTLPAIGTFVLLTAVFVAASWRESANASDAVTGPTPTPSLSPIPTPSPTCTGMSTHWNHYSNPDPIAPADRVSNAPGSEPGLPSNYPSIINMGFDIPQTCVIGYLAIDFAISSERPDDLDILVVDPQGRKSLIISDAGGNDPMTWNGYLFRVGTNPFPDEAAPPVGYYMGANYAGLPSLEPDGIDNFPNAGGTAQYTVDFGALTGGGFINYGPWKLYVVDDETGNLSSLPRGWRISVYSLCSIPGGCASPPPTPIPTQTPTPTPTPTPTHEPSLSPIPTPSPTCVGISSEWRHYSNADPIAPADRVSNEPGSEPGLPTNYPSIINIPTVDVPETCVIGDIAIDFTLSSERPDDLDILVVDPEGRKSLVISDAGGDSQVTGTGYLFRTFGSTFPDTFVPPAGYYSPVDYAGLLGPEPDGKDNFPNVDGLAQYQANFWNLLAGGWISTGDWKLYVVDDETGNLSSLPQGWRVSYHLQCAAGGGCPTPFPTPTPPTPTPTPSPTPSSSPLSDPAILFISDRDGNNEIYRMNADGSDQRRLTTSPESELIAYWTPDGTNIVYLRASTSFNSQIWVMNADGSDKTLISDQAGNYYLHRVSPNGEKVLYATKDATEHLWTMNIDGSDKTQLTSSGMIDHFAEWSPDGSKIAFGRCNQSFICDIWTMNADGSDEVNLTSQNPNDDDAPLWTPDGAKIVFSAQTTPEDYNAFIMNADGSGRQQLTFGEQFFFTEQLSPDGNKIGLNFTTGSIGAYEIAAYTVDTSTLVPLTQNSAFDDFGAWSPDGSTIAFNSRRDTTANEIYSMNADGSAVVRLTNNVASDSVSDWYRRPAARISSFDHDGDGKTDFSVFRPSSGAWYLQRSTAGFVGLQFGVDSDRLTPADYDGDGKTDIAVYRPSAGQWYVLNSATGTVSYPLFGVAEDVPAPGDYDGDGKADVTVFRPSQGTWYRQNSSNGSFFAMQFGATGDVPTVGDFDGDGKNDLGIFRPSIGDWYNLRSADGSVFGERFGQTGDRIAPADYDGDGKTDIAIFRPSTRQWVVRNSATVTYSFSVFGAVNDVPVAGDYDGDGKADIGVWRPENGTWYVQQSSNGEFIVFPWGQNGDVPTPSAYGN